MYWFKNLENMSNKKSHAWTPLKSIYVYCTNLVFGLHIWYQKYPVKGAAVEI
jgi:hypothetical protein